MYDAHRGELELDGFRWRFFAAAPFMNSRHEDHAEMYCTYNKGLPPALRTAIVRWESARPRQHGL